MAGKLRPLVSPRFRSFLELSKVVKKFQIVGIINVVGDPQT